MRGTLGAERGRFEAEKGPFCEQKSIKIDKNRRGFKVRLVDSKRVKHTFLPF
jgi:hypothetical protein